MTAVKWVRFRRYAGCYIGGTASVLKPTSMRHMDRAFYLTAQIEAPHYGAVQSYDGAAMSGGPLHNIAVYPRGMRPGSLFQLLHALDRISPAPASLLRLWEAYREHGWGVTKGGVLRATKDKRVVTGTEIRETFTPNNGRVPRRGDKWETARRWALLHHAVFSDPLTFDAQKEFAIDWLLTTQHRVESLFYQKLNPKEVVVGCGGLSLEEDLALSVYHCYSVNAPAPARTDFLAATRAAARGRDFSKTLLMELGRTSYGNWERRYVRTRNAAMKSELWPRDLFLSADAIFPERALT